MEQHEHFTHEDDCDGHVFVDGVCDLCGAENACNHVGFVSRGECFRCGKVGLEPDCETFEKENPR